MKPSEFKISISVESYNEKLLKITKILTLPKSRQFPNYQRYRSQILIAQIQDIHMRYVKNSYHINFSRNELSKSVTVGSGWFIVLNDSACRNWSYKFIYIFFDLLLRFQSCLNVIEAIHIRLIIGTFLSLVIRKRRYTYIY